MIHLKSPLPIVYTINRMRMDTIKKMVFDLLHSLNIIILNISSLHIFSYSAYDMRFMYSYIFKFSINV